MTSETIDTPDGPTPDGIPGRRRWSRRRRAALGVALVLLLALIALWLARRPIADSYVRRALADRGVPARYRIEELSFGRQRLTDVVIGDPRNPDLVADWAELRTRVTLAGPEVTGVRVGRVRLRGRLVDGTVSLGAIDRLLPAPSGKPFALPALDARIGDARMRLETPGGVVGLKLSGSGRLDDGFSGDLAAVSERLAVGSGCAVAKLQAAVAIRITDARPSIAGPVRAASLACGDTRAAGLATRLDVTLGERLDRWQGNAQLAVADAAGAGARVRGLKGRVDFTGSARDTQGSASLESGAFAAAGVGGAGLAIDGRYRIGARQAFAGTASATGVALPEAMLRQVAELGSTGAGSPVGPLMAALANAGVAAGRRFDAAAQLDVANGGEGGRLLVRRLSADAASGASVVLAGEGVAYDWPDGAARLNGTLTIGGGGLPEAVVQLAQAQPGGAVTGSAILRPYAAGGARLALTPVAFTRARDGSTRFDTQATLSGPLGDGRVEGLRVPLSGRWDGRAGVVVNPECVGVGWQRLAVSSLVLDAARLRLCPTGGALVSVGRGGLSGGARLGATRLGGTLGSTPVTLAMRGGRFGLADFGFALDGVETRLGAAERVSRLDIGRLEGRIAGGGVGGRFADGAGQIANVPLLLSGAAGDWRFAGGTLRLTGGLKVDDAQTESRRFETLASDDVALTLAGNAIAATGTLKHPAKGVTVATVRIAHELGSGAGEAELKVPGIAFGPDFQPNELTPLTFGVIADVKGSVSGEGRIAWNAQGVTSGGVFRTAGTDLAAAFGPATGISGEVRFTDLLGLVTAPNQLLTIAEANPGIPFKDGQLRYRLIAGQRIQIEGGRWPLAGGEMVLEPTVLDFAPQTERRMTFRVTGVDAGLFLQEFAFENLNASGTFDGVLPMVFDARGGRIEGGRLVAREGGGNLAYVGEVTKEDIGVWGNLAFQALKSLDYRNLTIEMDGPLAGEMVTAIRFAGVSQGEGTSSNFLIRRLARLPFVFNVRIKAPFRQLIDSVQSYYDPSRLIQRNLPALMDAQEARERQQGAPATVPPAAATPKPVQPPVSEDRP
ncbi:YdbH domain-containing protein [Sphingomonas sp. ac-8]|uniref:YdbH domain-containing protein n=1 Tax=Sphingomonas sp. ac-8 TaxID=3242977 RepID=UPI003A801A92